MCIMQAPVCLPAYQAACPSLFFSTTAYHDIAIKNRNLLSFPFPSVVFILCVPVSLESFINDVNPECTVLGWQVLI